MEPASQLRSLREEARLVERGVRALALVSAPRAHADYRMFVAAMFVAAPPGVVPFVLNDGTAGFASHGWVVDLLAWARAHAPHPQVDQITGLLLGYSPESIRQFSERGAHLGPEKEPT